MNYLIKDIIRYNIGNYIENINISNYTTFGVGGIGKLLVYPNNIESLDLLIKLIKKYNLEYKIIGNGSNLVFSSKIYNKILIKLDRMDKYDINGDEVVVGAGVSLMKLSREVADYGLSGLEFASGIPGTVGGAIFQNAGAYNSDMSHIIKSVTVYENGKFKEYTNSDCNFSYRSSIFKNKTNLIIIKCILKLNKGNKEEIKNTIKERCEQRIKSQPIEYKTAGSVFKNPPNYSSWKLISDLGLKGYKIGGSSISMKHANFIINENHATGEDIKKLVEYIQAEVYKKYNIKLECEQEFINF